RRYALYCRCVGRIRPTVDPVAVHAAPDQVTLPAVVRHRHDDLSRCLAPARGVRIADVLLRWRPLRKQPTGVSLATAPVDGDLAAVDDHYQRRREPGSAQRAGPSQRSRYPSGRLRPPLALPSGEDSQEARPAGTTSSRKPVETLRDGWWLSRASAST